MLNAWNKSGGFFISLHWSETITTTLRICVDVPRVRCHSGFHSPFFAGNAPFLAALAELGSRHRLRIIQLVYARGAARGFSRPFRQARNG